MAVLATGLCAMADTPAAQSSDPRLGLFGPLLNRPFASADHLEDSIEVNAPTLVEGGLIEFDQERLSYVDGSVYGFSLARSEWYKLPHTVVFGPDHVVSSWTYKLAATPNVSHRGSATWTVFPDGSLERRSTYDTGPDDVQRFFPADRLDAEALAVLQAEVAEYKALREQRLANARQSYAQECASPGQSPNCTAWDRTMRMGDLPPAEFHRREAQARLAEEASAMSADERLARSDLAYVRRELATCTDDEECSDLRLQERDLLEELGELDPSDDAGASAAARAPAQADQAGWAMVAGALAQGLLGNQASIGSIIQAPNLPAAQPGFASPPAFEPSLPSLPARSTATLRPGSTPPPSSPSPAIVAASARPLPNGCATIQRTEMGFAVINGCGVRIIGSFCWEDAAANSSCPRRSPGGFGPLAPGAREGISSGSGRWRTAACDYDEWNAGRCRPELF